METIYEGLTVDNKVVREDLHRLTNQIWKLIPMRENAESWDSHLDSIILEIVGLQKIFSLNLLILISKLEGLRVKGSEISFRSWRRIIFRAINLLGEVLNSEQLR